MSSLWRVRMIEKSQDSINLALRAIHPDIAEEVPTTKVFALRLLMDAPSGQSDLSPYSDREAAEQFADRVIESVSVTAQRNFPFRGEEVTESVYASVKSRGASEGNPDTFRQALSQEWQEFWDDPERFPSATVALQIRPTSTLPLPALNSEWDSAAYG